MQYTMQKSLRGYPTLPTLTMYLPPSPTLILTDSILTAGRERRLSDLTHIKSAFVRFHTAA